MLINRRKSTDFFPFSCQKVRSFKGLLLLQRHFTHRTIARFVVGFTFFAVHWALIYRHRYFGFYAILFWRVCGFVGVCFGLLTGKETSTQAE